MRKSILLFCCLGIVNILIAQQTNNSSWPVQTDSVYHFTFKRPPTWDLKLPGTNTRFFLTSQAENEKDLFRENINCITRVIEQAGFKISNAADAIKQSLSEKLKDYKLLKSAYSTWNNSQTLVLEYTCTQESGDTTYTIHILQRLAVVKNTLFTFTYTAEEAGYNKYIDIVNKVFLSLKIKQ
jgi:hypothetical protein